MDTIKEVIESATTFYNKLRKDKNGRYRSWEHCYKCFYEARKKEKVDYDNLSLNLAFYLASWGMYRGSSFLLQKDYKVHEPVVKEIIRKKYDCLLGIKCSELREEEVQKLLKDLYRFMEEYYDGIRESVKETDVKNEVSSILITKILMGTLGCVPAYDRYFVDGVRDLKSLLGLVDFYEDNHEELENTRKALKMNNITYPQMKMLDMAF